MISACTAAALAQTWDTSGNGMLNGTCYFREVFYIVGDGYGDLTRAIALYGNVSFNGAGSYTMTATVADSNSSYLQNASLSGTYSISASGYGFISNPLSTGDYIYGLVSGQGIFVGSSTEAGFNDLFVAAPVASPAATNATLRGSYQVAYTDLSGGYPEYAIGSWFQMNPDGAGNIGTVNLSSYMGQYGTSVISQTATGVKYAFSNGAANVQFPNSTTLLVSGQEYLYISPDGNFVFGGSPIAWDFFVGVRAGSAAPTFSGLYYQAGIDEDDSNVASGYGVLDTYYGALNAASGTAVGHQRVADVFNTQAIGYTYSEPFTLKSDGTYSTAMMRYAVGANGAVRVGSGVGPYLGINVALAAPSLTGSGVYLNPAGIVNAASSAPFTAGISPGELITLYGTNLASDVAVAATVPFPTTMRDVQVLINGTPAPLYVVSPGAISAVVPYSITASIAQVQVINGGAASNTVSMFTAATTPGAFTVPPGGTGYAAALHPDYSLVSAASPAKPGETIAVYLTGLGPVTPAVTEGAAASTTTLSNTNVTIAAYVGGTTATVGFAGLAPGLAGLYQLNVTIPSGATAGDNVLAIAGPDSYATEALIPVGTGSTAEVAHERPAPVKFAPHGRTPHTRQLTIPEFRR